MRINLKDLKDADLRSHYEQMISGWQL